VAILVSLNMTRLFARDIYKNTSLLFWFPYYSLFIRGPEPRRLSGEQDNDDKNDDHAQTAGRIIAPARAVGPNRSGTDQKQDQYDNQNKPHKNSPFQRFGMIAL
jgi:hypothetical protein